MYYQVTHINKHRSLIQMQDIARILASAVLDFSQLDYIWRFFLRIVYASSSLIASFTLLHFDNSLSYIKSLV